MDGGGLRKDDTCNGEKCAASFQRYVMVVMDGGVEDKR